MMLPKSSFDQGGHEMALSRVGIAGISYGDDVTVGIAWTR
jgi:hypothetical protein